MTRPVLATLALLPILAVSLADDARAGGSAKAGKADICHYSSDDGRYHLINVSTNALDAHFDNHGDSYPGTFFVDDDGDGHGDASSETVMCPTEGYVDDSSDCDDTDPAVSPSATEVPYDGIDNDCLDGTPDDDLDGDGYGMAADCDDGDSAVNPGEPETPYDGIDNDCDTGTPDDDLDDDGYGIDEDCDDDDQDVSPGATEVCGDGIDNDCNGAIDEDCAEAIVGPVMQVGTYAGYNFEWSNGGTSYPGGDDAICAQYGYTTAVYMETCGIDATVAQPNTQCALATCEMWYRPGGWIPGNCDGASFRAVTYIECE